MTDVQRREDTYQIPARVLEDIAEKAAQKAVEAATPEIAEKAAKMGVQMAMMDLQQQAGAGLFQLAKYVLIGSLVALAGWLAMHNGKNL